MECMCLSKPTKRDVEKRQIKKKERNTAREVKKKPYTELRYERDVRVHCLCMYAWAVLRTAYMLSLFSQRTSFSMLKCSFCHLPSYIHTKYIQCSRIVGGTIAAVRYIVYVFTSFVQRNIVALPAKPFFEFLTKSVTESVFAHCNYFNSF